MSLIYIANVRFPTEKAHGIQIAETLNALNNQGIPVQAIFPKRNNPITKNPADYYCLSKLQSPTYLTCWDLIHNFPKSFVAYAIQSFTFYLSCLLYLSNKSPSILYTRSWPLALFLSFLKQHKLVVELHELPETSFSQNLLKFILNRIDKVVSTNQLLANDLKKITTKSIVVIPNGANPSRYQPKLNTTKARKLLKLPSGQFLVIYTGSLAKWKGIDTLITSATHLPKTIKIIIVGGTPDQTQLFTKKKNSTIQFVGQVPPVKIPIYQQAADLLIIPNSKEKSFSAKYTAPIKLFEYLQANRPILAADVPAIKQFAPNLILFKADNPKDLAKQINAIYKNKKLQQKLLTYINSIKNEFTWEKRAEKIVELINSNKFD